MHMLQKDKSSHLDMFDDMSGIYFDQFTVACHKIISLKINGGKLLPLKRLLTETHIN